MTLIQCPECNRQISDKAHACPGCGYPVRSAIQEGEIAYGQGNASSGQIEPKRDEGEVQTDRPQQTQTTERNHAPSSDPPHSPVTSSVAGGEGEGFDVLGVLDGAREMSGSEWFGLVFNTLLFPVKILGIAAFFVAILILFFGGLFLGSELGAPPDGNPFFAVTVCVLMWGGAAFLIVLAFFVRKRMASLVTAEIVSRKPRVEDRALPDPQSRHKPRRGPHETEDAKIKLARCVGASFVTVPAVLLLGRPKSLLDYCLSLGVGLIVAVIAGRTPHLKVPFSKPIKLLKFRARTVGQAILEGLIAGVVIPIAFALFAVIFFAFSQRDNEPTRPGDRPSHLKQTPYGPSDWRRGQQFMDELRRKQTSEWLRQKARQPTDKERMDELLAPPKVRTITEEEMRRMFPSLQHENSRPE